MKNRIGIVGGGQLGRMLAIAAKQMGFRVIVLDPTPSSPAGQVSDEQIVKSFKDPDAIRELASKSDFMTFEIESADAATLHELSLANPWINPSPKTLEIIKDKFGQKKFLEKHKIPVAESIQVDSREDALKAARKYSYPFLLKARYDAYDGRGNVLIKKEADIGPAFEKLSKSPLYAEKFVPFVKELSIMAARGVRGDIATYPVVETIHKNNICHTVIAPALVSASVKKKAEDLAKKTLGHLKGVGIFCMELFLTKDGKVLINEIAPRVHNSGHYSIEASATSQFEQHIRAISGLPLGETRMLVPSAVMVNILGDRNGEALLEGMHKALEIPGVAVHVYGKMETRKERKMGHITALGKNRKEALSRAEKAKKHISI